MAAAEADAATPSRSGRKRKQRHQSSNGKEPKQAATTVSKRQQPSPSEHEAYDSLDEALQESVAMDQLMEGAPLPVEVHHFKMRSLSKLLLDHHHTVSFEKSLMNELLGQAVAVTPPDVRELPCSAGMEHAIADLAASGQYSEQHLVEITMRLQSQLLHHMHRWQKVLTKRIAANQERLDVLCGRSASDGSHSTY